MPKKKGGGRKNGSRGEGGEPKPDKKAIEKQLKLLCDQANSLHDTAEQASTADQKLTVLQQSYAVYEEALKVKPTDLDTQYNAGACLIDIVELLPPTNSDREAALVRACDHFNSIFQLDTSGRAEVRARLFICGVLLNLQI